MIAQCGGMGNFAGGLSGDENLTRSDFDHFNKPQTTLCRYRTSIKIISMTCMYIEHEVIIKMAQVQ